MDGRELSGVFRDLAITSQRPDATLLLTLDQAEELLGETPGCIIQSQVWVNPHGEESMGETKPVGIFERAVWEAYLRVRENRGAAGVDRQSLEDFEQDRADNLYKLWNRLASGSYIPPPVLMLMRPLKWILHLSIATAVPVTIMPPTGGISTTILLGRPMSSPWRTTIVAGNATSPASRR